MTDIRPPVAVVSRGPHTAGVEAMVEQLEAEGQPVTLVCLDREPHAHRERDGDVMHVPLVSLSVASSVAAALARAPGGVLRAAARLLSPSAALRAAAVVHLARVLSSRGIAEVRAADASAKRLAEAIRTMADFRPPDLSAIDTDWKGIGASRVGVRWISRRINSVTAEVSTGGGARLVVKKQQPHPVLSPAERARGEYRALVAVREALNSEELTVPRVRHFDEQGAIIVMERARGRSLEELYPAAARDAGSLDRLTAGLRGAGRWLAALQRNTTRQAGGAAMVRETVAAAVADVERLAAGEAMVRRQVARLVDGLAALESRMLAAPPPVTGHHGDFFAANVFFDGRRVTVIDLEGFRDGLPAEDIAYFLLRSELLARRFRIRADLEAPFLDGYGRPVDAASLRLFTVTKGLRTLANGIGLDHPLPQRIWLRRSVFGIVLRAIGGE